MRQKEQALTCAKVSDGQVAAVVQRQLCVVPRHAEVLQDYIALRMAPYQAPLIWGMQAELQVANGLPILQHIQRNPSGCWFCLRLVSSISWGAVPLAWLLPSAAVSVPATWRGIPLGTCQL